MGKQRVQLGGETLSIIEEISGYRFKDRSLLAIAVTHRAIIGSSNRMTLQNQRLEFLGDSILSFAVADFLLNYFPNEDEGFLSKLRSKIVDNRNLAVVGERIGIGEIVRSLIDKHGGRGGRLSRKVYGDIYEAIVGAMYMDGGLPPTRSFVEITLLSSVDEISEREVDHKTVLQEWCQKKNISLPAYSLLYSTGPEHDKNFTVSVNVTGVGSATGNGNSKKDAEKDAASKLWESINEE